MSARPRQQFAQSDDEARRRFEQTRSTDPLPDVDPSLLNTSDLLDYIAATGMIYPFQIPTQPDKLLKPASCAIPFAGRVIAWNAKPNRPDRVKRFDKDLKPGQKLKLPRNSIVFITLEPYFRFPDYIAGRYNLAIRQIYRGLLVGTGPLVDPGFEGRLSVPVHNLTGGDYELRAGEPLVWMEFTKLSSNRRWTPNARESQSPFVPFPPRKLERQGLSDYLEAASPEPIVSSIPLEVGRARRAAQVAQRNVQVLQGVSLIAGVILLATIGGLVYQGVTAVRDAEKDRSALERRVTNVSRTVVAQRRELNAIRHKLATRKP